MLYVVVVQTHHSLLGLIIGYLPPLEAFTVPSDTMNLFYVETHSQIVGARKP